MKFWKIGGGGIIHQLSCSGQLKIDVANFINEAIFDHEKMPKELLG